MSFLRKDVAVFEEDAVDGKGHDGEEGLAGGGNRSHSRPVSSLTARLRGMKQNMLARARGIDYRRSLLLRAFYTAVGNFTSKNGFLHPTNNDGRWSKGNTNISAL